MVVPSIKINSDKMRPLYRNKNFMLLWVGSSVNSLTFSIFALSLPFIIFELTKSTLAMSTMRVIEFLPNLLLAILLGIITDRFNRKKVILCSVIVKILLIIFVTTLISTSLLTVWWLYILGFVLYTSSYLFGNAYHSSIPNIVDEKQLTEANSYSSFTSSINNIIGPAIAGIILFSFGYFIGLWITVVGLIILLTAVSFTKIPIHQQKTNLQKKTLWNEITEGWSSLRGNKPLWFLTIIVCLVNISSSLSFAVFAFYALNTYQLNETQLGIIFSGAASGGILAAIYAKKLFRIYKEKTIFLSCFVLAAIGYLILFTTSIWVMLVCGMLFIGLSNTFIGIYYSTLRQKTTPNHLMGRVAGTSSTIMKLSVPFAFLLSGILGEIINVKYIFLMSLIFMLFVISFYAKRYSVN